MSNKDLLKFSFYFCIVDAAICIPLFALSFLEGFGKLSPQQSIGLGLINVSYTVIYIIITLGLKVVLETFLNTRKYHDLFNIFIGLSCALAFLWIVSAVVPSAKKPLSVILLITGLGTGVLYIIPFFKTRKIASALQPQWRRFSIINIITGILMLTIVLSLFGVILNIVSGILGAMVFSKAAKLYDSQTSGGSAQISGNSPMQSGL